LGVGVQTGGMRQKHPDGDRVVREIGVTQLKGQIVVDVVIKVKEVLFIELHQRGADNGLGDGRKHIDGVYGRLFLFWHIVETISLGPDDGVVFYDTGGKGTEPCKSHKNGDLLIEEHVRG